MVVPPWWPTLRVSVMPQIIIDDRDARINYTPLGNWRQSGRPEEFRSSTSWSNIANSSFSLSFSGYVTCSVVSYSTGRLSQCMQQRIFRLLTSNLSLMVAHWRLKRLKNRTILCFTTLFFAPNFQTRIMYSNVPYKPMHHVGRVIFLVLINA